MATSTITEIHSIMSDNQVSEQIYGLIDQLYEHNKDSIRLTGITLASAAKGERKPFPWKVQKNTADDLKERVTTYGVVPKSIGMCVFDVDEGGEEVVHRIKEHFGEPVVVVKSRSKGFHVWYRCNGDVAEGYKPQRQFGVKDSWGGEFIYDNMLVYMWRPLNTIPHLLDAVYDHDSISDDALRSFRWRVRGESRSAQNRVGDAVADGSWELMKPDEGRHDHAKKLYTAHQSQGCLTPKVHERIKALFPTWGREAREEELDDLYEWARANVSIFTPKLSELKAAEVIVATSQMGVFPEPHIASRDGAKWYYRKDGDATWHYDRGDTEVKRRVVMALDGMGQDTSVRMRNSVVESLRVMLPVPEDRWDSHPLCVADAGGRVHALNGSEISSPESMYITLRLGAAIPDECDPPEFFLNILNKVLPEDGDVVKWFHRYLGSLLVGGRNKDEKFLVIYGGAGTGKTTVLEFLLGLFADYGLKVTEGKLASVGGGGHLTWLTDFNGPRLAIDSEVSEGRWTGSTINRLVSNETMRAHRMGQDTYEFTPQVKLVTACNVPPSIPDNAIEGFKRRIVMLPMDRPIPASELDKETREKLEVEAPQVLYWLKQQAIEYVRGGLLPTPELLKAEARTYIREEDVIGEWFEENVHIRPGDKGSFISSFDLHEHMRVSSGRKDISKTRLSQWLKRRPEFGLSFKYTNKLVDKRATRGFWGLEFIRD